MKLSTHSLSIGYSSRGAVKTIGRNLTLRLPEGKLTALLGSNGSGKSTLIRTLAGIQSPLEGYVALDSVDIASQKASDLARQIALVLQEPVRYANLLVSELVAFGRTPYTGWLGTLDRTDRERVLDSIEKAGITAIRDRNISGLSNGEWQKAIFAKALAQDTPVILLDEPTAHLDLLSKIDLIALLKKIAATGSKSILFSTHDLDFALGMADHLWLMDGKGSVHTGAPEDLVLQGRISEIYFTPPDRGFDISTGLLKIPAPEPGPEVKVEGTGLARLWTQKALERRGYRITESALAAFIVNIVHENDRTLWRVRSRQGEAIAASIAGLLEKLEAGHTGKAPETT